MQWESRRPASTGETGPPRSIELTNTPWRGGGLRVFLTASHGRGARARADATGGRSALSCFLTACDSRPNAATIFQVAASSRGPCRSHLVGIVEGGQLLRAPDVGAQVGRDAL